MYKIGEFSKLTGFSIKTLRYYDEIGLLKPSKTDDFTNYRYYEEKDLELYKKIIYLKNLGFTLEEIKNNIDHITVELLESKIEELNQKRFLIENQIRELYSLKNNVKGNIKIKTFVK